MACFGSDVHLTSLLIVLGLSTQNICNFRIQKVSVATSSDMKHSFDVL